MIRSLKRNLHRLQSAVWDSLSKANAASRYRHLIDSGVLLVGRHTYGSPEVDVYKGSEARVIIGHYTSISPRVRFIPGGIHPTNWVSLFPFRILWQLSGAFRDGMPSTNGDIIVGSDVWIGCDSLILSGVTIGDGSVVCAGSVVTRNVSPYSIVAGVPARLIAYRFDEPTRNALLHLSWWNWTDDRIREAVPYLSSADVEGFLTAVGPVRPI